MKGIKWTLNLFLMLVIPACKKNDSVSSEPETYILSISATSQFIPETAMLQVESLDTGRWTLADNEASYSTVSLYYSPDELILFNRLMSYGSPWQKPIYSSDGLQRVADLGAGSYSLISQSTRFGGEAILTAIESIHENGSMIPGIKLMHVNKEGIVSAAFFKNSELMNNGLVWTNGIQITGGKILTSLASIKEPDAGRYSYAEKGSVAVFSYPEIKLERVMNDERVGMIGRTYQGGLMAGEDGYTYVFSTTGTSGVTRFKVDEDSFDRSYFFNIGTASDGCYVNSWTDVGNGDVLALMSNKKLAIVNLGKGIFKWVSGLPQPAETENISEKNYASNKRTVYVGVTGVDKKCWIYKIDAKTAVAEKASEIVGGSVTGIYAFP